MTIEIWSINHTDRNISLYLCGMMPLQNHFCKKSVPSGQHPAINSLHVRPCIREMTTSKRCLTFSQAKSRKRVNVDGSEDNLSTSGCSDVDNSTVLDSEEVGL